MTNTTLSRLLDPIWRYGGPFPFWMQNVEQIEKFVNKYKLQPVDKTHFGHYMPADTGALNEEAVIKVLKRIPFPGGITAAHLHWRGDVYLVTAQQWKEFSSGFVKEFQTKLSKAHTLSFDSFLKLSEAIDTVPLPE